MSQPPRPPRRPANQPPADSPNRGDRPDRPAGGRPPRRGGPGGGRPPRIGGPGSRPPGRGPRPPRGPHGGDGITPGTPTDPAVAGLGPVSGELIDTTIERIVPGGDGIAHGGGLTIFVPLTAPGDEVRVEIDRRRGQVAWGKVTQLTTPGAHRSEPPCKFFGVCGGCDLQQLDYAGQLTAKVDIVRDCLTRIGRLEAPEDLVVVPSPDPLGYRHVAEWAIDSRNRRIGYRIRGTHDVLDVDHCPILTGQLNGVLADLRERQAMGLIPPGIDEIRGLAGDDGPGISPALGSQNAPELSIRVGDDTFHYDASVFFQANGLLLEELINEALWQADPVKHKDPEAPLSGDGKGFVIDLYAGVGLFSVPLARRYRRVVAVEGFGGATRWTRRNLRDAGLSHAKVETERVESWLARRGPALVGASLVVLDPPRTGVTPEAVEGILAMEPRRISYVSCDPATQTRDLKALVAGGYRLERVVALDMFPQTHHVEVVAHLVKA
ncbi:MAG TPA: TRAM domain-containing protein [Thermomicrobiales bacterium]|nr:TRAM domain-containing protein [Thermomicrobiales bacterium]